jgi:hypothetical protein
LTDNQKHIKIPDKSEYSTQFPELRSDETQCSQPCNNQTAPNRYRNTQAISRNHNLIFELSTHLERSYPCLSPFFFGVDRSVAPIEIDGNMTL